MIRTYIFSSILLISSLSLSAQQSVTTPSDQDAHAVVQIVAPAKERVDVVATVKEWWQKLCYKMFHSNTGCTQRNEMPVPFKISPEYTKSIEMQRQAAVTQLLRDEMRDALPSPVQKEVPIFAAR